MISRALAKLLLFITRILPASWARWLAVSLAPWVYLHPQARKGLLLNARHILGEDSSQEEREILAKNVLRSFGRALADLGLGGRLRHLADSSEIEVEGRENIEPFLNNDQGLISVSLHMGSYEVACMLLSERRGEVAVVYHRDPTGFFEEFRSQRRGDFPITEIAIDKSPYFGVELLERLKSGGTVLMAGELAAGTRGEAFEFLGGEANFSQWPTRLSHNANVPILPSFIVRTPSGGFKIFIEEPMFPKDFNSPREMMQELVKVFEVYVQRYPDQWLMVRPFWPQSS